MDNLGRPIHVRHMDPASQGANCFAKRREWMVKVVEHQWNSLSVLAEKLALIHPMDGGQDRDSECILGLPRGGEAGIELFHCERGTGAEPEPDKQRGQQDFSCVRSALTTFLRRHDDASVTRSKRRLLVGNFCL